MNVVVVVVVVDGCCCGGGAWSMKKSVCEQWKTDFHFILFAIFDFSSDFFVIFVGFVCVYNNERDEWEKN